MHECEKSKFENSRTNRIRFSWFWMVLNDVRVWIDSKDLKECNEHLKIGWEWLEIGFPLACAPRFFQFENRVSRAIFLFFLDRYASCIYTGWNWDDNWQESINIQCKSNLIFVQNQIFKIWLISNPILPYWSNFEICWLLWVSWISRKE